MAKSKQDAIMSYVTSHVNEHISTSALAAATGVSLPTVLTFIKNNSQHFTKIKHGTYRINSGDSQIATAAGAISASSTPEPSYSAGAATAPAATQALGGDDIDDTSVSPARPFEW